MSSFTENVILKPAKNTNKWILVNEITYYVGAEISNDKISVPSGYEFDGASIPRFFRSLIGHPLDTKIIRAALIHDYIYTHEKHRGRKQADEIFLEAMLVSKVSIIKAVLCFGAVRVAGRTVF